MQINDVMTKDVKYVDPKTSVKEVAELMKKHDCGSIPVAKDDKLVGMITDRDIVLRCIAAQGDEGLSMTAEKCMSPRILYCYSTDKLEDVLENMGQNAIKRLPVLDSNKKLAGIVSFGDLSAACEDKSLSGNAMEKIREAA